MDSYLMITGFTLLALLLLFTGGYMLASPRRFAAACEVFAAAGNLPSLLPRSVKSALFQVRAIGLFSLATGLILAAGTVQWMPYLVQAGSGQVELDWLIVPAMLGISAGYVILLYGGDWVTRKFLKVADHPLVPQDLIVALTWELRIAGVAFTLFGLGAGSVWFRTWIH